MDPLCGQRAECSVFCADIIESVGIRSGIGVDLEAGGISRAVAGEYARIISHIQVTQFGPGRNRVSGPLCCWELIDSPVIDAIQLDGLVFNTLDIGDRPVHYRKVPAVAG